MASHRHRVIEIILLLTLDYNYRFPMTFLPNTIAQIIQTSVSVKRLAKFLSLEELNFNQVDRTPHKGLVYIQLMVISLYRQSSADTTGYNFVSLRICSTFLWLLVYVEG